MCANIIRVVENGDKQLCGEGCFFFFFNQFTKASLYNKSEYEILKVYRICWVEKEKFQFSCCQSQAFSEIGSDSLAMCVRVIYICGMEPESSARFG